MRQALYVLVVLTLLALIAGCRVVEEVEAPPTSAAADVEGVEEGISDIDALNEELNISELEYLESELEEIEW